MITELCPRCWLYHAPEAECKAALALGQAWLVKPPVDLPPVDLSPIEPAIVTLQSDNKQKRIWQRKGGAWSEEEKQIMHEVFANGYSSELLTVAVSRLERDRTQVRAMVGNMKLRKPKCS